MTISKLISSARLAEVNGTVTNILNTFNTAEIVDDATLQEVMDELNANNVKLTIAIEKDRATSKLEEFDEARDKAYSNLYQYIKVNAGIEVKNITDKVNRVFDILKKYPNISRLSNTEKTSQINSLLNDLATDEVTTNLQYMNLGLSLRQDLIKAQTAFEEAYNQYLEDKKNDKTKQSASAVKPLVLDTLNNKLVVLLRTQVMFNREIYADFGHKVQLAIEQTNSYVRARRNA